MSARLRTLRLAAGLTQGDLAARAGVSRQLVGAVEAGRHLPRVDAALSLATALGITVDQLFGAQVPPVDVISGERPLDGSTVRVGAVGDLLVTSPARVGADGWDVADGVAGEGAVTVLGRLAPGLVVVGCEPGLVLLERLLRESGRGALAAMASSEAARSVLGASRAHAAVVHGPEDVDLAPPGGLTRIHLARWQVGLAAPVDAPTDWWRSALAGEVPVVQREREAGVQRAFEAVAGAGVPGPRVAAHLPAAFRAVHTGMPAVTIEPAALAAGAGFHPLGTHRAELWVDPTWANDRVVTDALDILVGGAFTQRLASVGGYDLGGLGDRVA